MERITKEYEVYRFEELDKEIQNKLIEQEKETQYQLYIDTYLYDDMKEEAQRLLEKYFKGKATYINVYYSLSWCQGDGAMIEFDLYYYNKYIKIRHNGWYYHSRSFTIEDYYLTEKQEEQLKNKIIKMNEELEEIGWKLVSYEPEDELCIDYLKEHKYLKNGEVFE